jgi:hypothetical protein
MNISKKMYRYLILVSLLLPSLAYAEKILDRVDIVETKTEVNVQIKFLTQVRYLRHFPTKEASRIQIFLEFPQFPVLPTEREFLSSAPTNLVPSFVINYPEQITNSIAIRFKEPVKFRVTPDSSGRGIVIRIKKKVTPATKAPAAKAPVVKAPSETKIDLVGEIPVIPEGMSADDYAGQLVEQSKAARGVGDYPRAIQLLNAVLSLPPHKYSQEALELIANTREKNGESEKAKAEYETYLKLYPATEGAERARQRIAVIDEATKASGVDAEKEKKAIREVHETSVYGSWSQYYYGANSHNYNSGSIPDSHSHDQSSLVSTIDVTGRSRQNQYDSKIVFRNIQTMDFLPDRSNRDRTLAAYLEVQNNEADYLVRLGRQNGNTGGVLGRFDGAWLRYGLTPKYKINLVAGSLDEFDVDYKRHFYGVNLDIGPVADNWSGNVYVINQTVDDITDRRAVGGELRYFDNRRSMYSLLDYDTLFNKVNIALIQGNWQTEDAATNYNFLIDHRKSPALSMVNSLPAYSALGAFTVRQALRRGLVTESQMRDDAKALTLDTDLVLFGVTRQITPRWQLGADIQWSRSSGTQEAGAAAVANANKAAVEAGQPTNTFDFARTLAQIGSGSIWTYHLQAIGTDTLFKGDTSIISTTFTDGQNSSSQALVLTNVVVPRDKWRIDSSLRLLRLETDTLATSSSSFEYVLSPTVRASYRLRDKATLEAEIGVEVSNRNDPINGHSRTVRDFSFIGYRIDF